MVTALWKNFLRGFLLVGMLFSCNLGGAGGGSFSPYVPANEDLEEFEEPSYKVFLDGDRYYRSGILQAVVSYSETFFSPLGSQRALQRRQNFSRSLNDYRPQFGYDDQTPIDGALLTMHIELLGAFDHNSAQPWRFHAQRRAFFKAFAELPSSVSVAHQWRFLLEDGKQFVVNPESYNFGASQSQRFFRQETHYDKNYALVTLGDYQWTRPSSVSSGDEDVPGLQLFVQNQDTTQTISFAELMAGRVLGCLNASANCVPQALSISLYSESYQQGITPTKPLRRFLFNVSDIESVAYSLYRNYLISALYKGSDPLVGVVENIHSGLFMERRHPDYSSCPYSFSIDGMAWGEFNPFVNEDDLVITVTIPKSCGSQEQAIVSSNDLDYVEFFLRPFASNDSYGGDDFYAYFARGTFIKPEFEAEAYTETHDSLIFKVRKSFLTTSGTWNGLSEWRDLLKYFYQRAGGSLDHMLVYFYPRNTANPQEEGPPASYVQGAFFPSLEVKKYISQKGPSRSR